MSLFNFTHRNTRLAMAGGLLVLAAGAFGGGCGNAYPTEAEFCAGAAEVECNAVVVTECYGSQTDDALTTDAQSCIRARSQVQICNPARLPYHPTFAEQCIEARAQLWAEGRFTLAQKKVADEACLPVFNKGGLEGSSCSADADCDLSLQDANGVQMRCVQHAGSPGSCRFPKETLPGTRCSADPAAQCTNGFFCDGNNCIQNQGKNASCDSGESCDDGLRCGLANAGDKERVCLAQADNGKPCAADAECEGGFCLGTSAKGSTGLCSGTYSLSFATTCSAFRSN